MLLNARAAADPGPVRACEIVTDDWLQLLLTTLFAVIALRIGHRARRGANARPADASASPAVPTSTFASIVGVDSAAAPALAVAPWLPCADVTRRRRLAAPLPPPTSRPRAVGP